MITTAKVMEILKVSRSWVNMHLRRQLGTEEPETDGMGRRFVMYDEEKLLEWFNTNAKFSRQTKLFNFYDFTNVFSREGLDQALEKINKLENADAREFAYSQFIPNVLDKEQAAEYAKVLVKHRKVLDFVDVDMKLNMDEFLWHLQTAKGIAGDQSIEMAYRHIYSRGMIKIELFGRSWFIVPRDEWYEYNVLMPATFEIKKKRK